jgi:endonuclease/exonuclease/phosphatase family metal-dependent hydrolase
MRFFVRNLILTLNIVAVIFLFLAVGAKYISPQTIWWLSFLGMAFPLIFLVHVGFTFFWLFMRKKQFLISLISLILVYPSIQATYAVSDKESTDLIGKKYQIMSYNVKNFDLYNWSKNAATRQNMLTQIKVANPDILCLQEFYSQDTLGFRNRKYFTDTLGYPYSYFKQTVSRDIPLARGDKKMTTLRWGVAIFSRLPIVDTGFVSFDNALNNTCAWADIRIDSQVVRVYNTHLQSVHLGYKDYTKLQEFEDTKTIKWWDVKSILRKFKTASAKRAVQVDKIKMAMKSSSSPIIFCGDFNDLPISYSVYQIGTGFIDAFVEKGRGFGATYVSKLPFFRIDYMFFDKTFLLENYTVLPESYSDHHAVVVTFRK